MLTQAEPTSRLPCFAFPPCFGGYGAELAPITLKNFASRLGVRSFCTEDGYATLLSTELRHVITAMTSVAPNRLIFGSLIGYWSKITQQAFKLQESGLVGLSPQSFPQFL